MSCGDFVSYWGSIASFIGIPLSLIGILLTKTVKDTIVGARFQSRLTSIIAKMRDAERNGNMQILKDEITVLVHTFETCFKWHELKYSARISKAYKEAKLQSTSATPNIRVLEGLLANFKTLHAEVNP